MSQSYDPAAIESKWQALWEESRPFRALSPGDEGFLPEQRKYYVLDMFPYPSGAGLHVGHPMGYIGSDIVARKKRMQGFNVLHPMGFDAFGLPAEQYAIQTGKHPAETTGENIANYRRQLKMIGLSYDWSRCFSTSTPDYYRWTQWIFTRLYDRGLAYQAEVPVWWCDALKTVLSNEEVIDGRSERGDHPCERRPLRQWMLKITEYADRLIDDLDEVDWPSSVKTMQREWIGRSEGAEIRFPVLGKDVQLEVFTTRPDTLFGATFMVVSPEHPMLDRLTGEDERASVEAYRREASSKSELQRMELSKDKTGVFTGSWALNPVMDPADPEARIPIWVADYVLMGYGSGAIMCVPGHDKRDHEFATAFGLTIRQVVRSEQESDAAPAIEDECYVGLGISVHSPLWDDLPTEQAKEKALALVTERGVGQAKVNYRLRDWLFSRQRYWGEPFPVLHGSDGTHQRVRDEDLPVELPPMDDFAPPADGSPPLSKATEWVQVTDPKSGEIYLRDTDTMPGWAGSCWYYLRFMDAHNSDVFASQEAVQYWNNVDLYIGGTEHAVLHLLYARFWHKVLYDEGLVPTKEPFQQLFNQGMVQAFAYKDSTGRLVSADEVTVEGQTGRHTLSGEALEQVVAKMSKSLKNVVNPDDVCREHGVDTFRLYEMFMGPLADSKPWNPRDVPGSRRFLDRLWRLYVDPDGEQPIRPQLLQNTADGAELTGGALELERGFHRCLARVEDSFKQFNFNTAVAAFMEFMNLATKHMGALTRSQAERLVCALAPFAPHVAEELWDRLGHAGGVTRAPWPRVDERFLEVDGFELVVQVNGKVRGRAQASKESGKQELEDLAAATVAEHLDGKERLKTIVVPGRLVNFVVR